MRKLSILMVVLVAVALAVAKDSLLYLATAVATGLAVWLVGKVFGKKIKWWVATTLTVAGFLPLAFIAAVTLLRMRLDPGLAADIGLTTAWQSATYFAGNIPYFILEHFAGVVVGMLVKG